MDKQTKNYKDLNYQNYIVKDFLVIFSTFIILGIEI